MFHITNGFYFMNLELSEVLSPKFTLTLTGTTTPGQTDVR